MNKGFSLIELLVVVAIIGVLAAAGTAAYNGFINMARIEVVQGNCHVAKSYIEAQLYRCLGGNRIETYSLNGSRTISNPDRFGQIAKCDGGSLVNV